jgi:hypothetical protein
MPDNTFKEHGAVPKRIERKEDSETAMDLDGLK